MFDFFFFFRLSSFSLFFSSSDAMFVLVLLEDIVRIPPEEFKKEGEAIHHQLNAKFSNKVRLARSLLFGLL